jgi:hypothetical protein
MNAKKLLIGGIVGGIVYFLLGWLTYGKLLMSYFKDHPGLSVGYDRAMPLFLYLIIGNLLQGFLLSYVFVKGKISSFGSGFVAGGVIGFLGGSAFDSIMYATTTLMSRTAVAADVIAFTIMSAITGAIVAVASGTGEPSA